MKLSIWKFPLKVINQQTIMMPINARILSVQSQNGTPCIWAIIDAEEQEQEGREFEIFGTGKPFYEDSHFGKEHKFIATFQQHNGSFVGHLFELVEAAEQKNC